MMAKYIFATTRYGVDASENNLGTLIKQLPLIDDGSLAIANIFGKSLEASAANLGSTDTVWVQGNVEVEYADNYLVTPAGGVLAKFYSNKTIVAPCTMMFVAPATHRAHYAGYVRDSGGMGVVGRNATNQPLQYRATIRASSSLGAAASITAPNPTAPELVAATFDQTSNRIRIWLPRTGLEAIAEPTDTAAWNTPTGGSRVGADSTWSDPTTEYMQVCHNRILTDAEVMQYYESAKAMYADLGVII